MYQDAARPGPPAGAWDSWFTEEFHVADDRETLAVDFWAYLNAWQAGLGWDPDDDRAWLQLEDALRELKPALLDAQEVDFGRFLKDLAQRWAHRNNGGASGTGAQEREGWHRLGRMLGEALDLSDQKAGGPHDVDP